MSPPGGFDVTVTADIATSCAEPLSIVTVFALPLSGTGSGGFAALPLSGTGSGTGSGGFTALPLSGTGTGSGGFTSAPVPIASVEPLPSGAGCVAGELFLLSTKNTPPAVSTTVSTAAMMNGVRFFVPWTWPVAADSVVGDGVVVGISVPGGGDITPGMLPGTGVSGGGVRRTGGSGALDGISCFARKPPTPPCDSTKPTGSLIARMNSSIVG